MCSMKCLNGLYVIYWLSQECWCKYIICCSPSKTRRLYDGWIEILKIPKFRRLVSWILLFYCPHQLPPIPTIRRELTSSMHPFLLELSFLRIKPSYTKVHLPIATNWRSGARLNGARLG